MRKALIGTTAAMATAATLFFAAPEEESTDFLILFDAQEVVVDTVTDSVNIGDNTPIKGKGSVIAVKPGYSEWGKSECPPRFLVVTVDRLKYADGRRDYANHELAGLFVDSLFALYQAGQLPLETDTILYLGRDTVEIERRFVIAKNQIAGKLNPPKYYPEQ